MKGSSPEMAPRPYAARPVAVLVDDGELPREVDGKEVASIREAWLVEEGWWSAEPLCRQYFELITVGGENLTLFRSLPEGTWFLQRA